MDCWVDAAELTTSLSPRMASSRMLGSASISEGVTWVKVCVARLYAQRHARPALPPPPRVLPAPKNTVVSVAATARARVAPVSGMPRLMT